MRFVPFVGSLGVLALEIGACAPRLDARTDCEDDAAACPMSRRTASAVTCDCTCELPELPIVGGDRTKFRGKVDACLPPQLNVDLAPSRAALDEMTQPRFNQEVFMFCRDTVRDWLALTINSQIEMPKNVPDSIACQAYECRCTTSGAQMESKLCSQGCDERRCDKDNCAPILRKGGTLEHGLCNCTRTEACGRVEPAREQAPLCHPILLAFERSRS